jgi:hypothetical protein
VKKMLSKYAPRWSDPEKRKPLRLSIGLGQFILLISLLSSTIILFYVLVFVTGIFQSCLNQFQQKPCYSTPETNREGNFLEPFLRRFNAPEDAHKDFAEEFSLLEEAHMADKGGFLRLREPSGRVGYYGVSMYHQLHCLKMLRDRIEGKDHEHGHRREVIDDQVTPDHLIHCLDYMAQVSLSISYKAERGTDPKKAVVCSADDTVEPARIKKLPDGYHIAVIDSTEAVHHCRDSRALTKMVEDSEANPISIEELKPGVTVEMLAG